MRRRVVRAFRKRLVEQLDRGRVVQVVRLLEGPRSERGGFRRIRAHLSGETGASERHEQRERDPPPDHAGYVTGRTCETREASAIVAA